MASPNYVTALMPPSPPLVISNAESDADIDLSVLFEKRNIGSAEFLLEIDPILVDMKNDRENIVQYIMEVTAQMDEKTALLEAELKAKDENMERLRECHRQKEHLLQEKMNAIRSEFRVVENINLLSTVYFKEMIKRIAGVISDGEEFIKSFECPNKAEKTKTGSREGAQSDVAGTVVVSDDSDDEVTANESMINENPTAAIDQPGPSNVEENGSVVTDDESLVEEKENVAPITNAPAIGPIQTGDNKTAKAIKSMVCKWCGELIPRKLWSQHKLDVHKIPHKDNKSTAKLEHILKRKNADDDQSDDEVSISSVTRSSLVSLRVSGQGMVKPKRAKKMFTSSPS